MILIIKWYLILLAISYIIAFKHKKLKINQLHCGLFGFCGDPKIMTLTMARLVQAKLKVLGLYNVDRGKHSCGIYIDNTIYKGVDDRKVFSDFISYQHLPDAMRSGNFTVIAHTRAATHGTHTRENAHPFVVEDKFLLAHNGVIRNIWDLCNKYSVNHAGITVDSEALAHLIHKEGFGVLNEYQGFAALLMAKANEPNSLYIYRGSSKRYAAGTEEEERPLFFMQTDEGTYVSSIEKSLMAISDNEKDKVMQVEANIVHKITNGRFTRARVHITRGANNFGVYNGIYVNSPKALGVGANSQTTTVIPTTSAGPTNCTIGSSYPVASNSHTPSSIIPAIWHETLPARAAKWKSCSSVFYHEGRHWTVDKDGIIVLAHGHLLLNRKGKVLPAGVRDCHSYYFFEGVMMKDLTSFRLASEDGPLTCSLYNFALLISKYSEYPVCNTRKDITQRCKNVSDYNKFRWYKDEAMLTDTVCVTPKFSDRRYVIKEGLLHSISSHLKQENGPCINNTSLKAEREMKQWGGTRPAVPAIPARVVDIETKIAIEQQQLPFKEEEKVEDNKEKLYNALDVKNFYRVWESIEEARSTFSVLEINAMRFYIADIMANDMNTEVANIYDDQVDVQLNMFLSIAIENNQSVHDCWKESEYQDILSYLLIAEESEDGKVYNDEEPNDISIEEGEVCEMVPKSKEDENSSVTGWVAANEVIKDTFTELEQAKVPPAQKEGEDEEDSEDDKTERNYSFEDIVDGLINIREFADELQAHEKDDFAQDVAYAVYKSVDPLLARLQELTETHNEHELGKELANNVKLRITP